MQPDYHANVYLLSTCNVTLYVGFFLFVVIQIGAEEPHMVAVLCESGNSGGKQCKLVR